MTEEIYKKGDYLKNNPTWHIEDSPWKAGQIIKILEKNCIQPNTICEVGCGAGEILNQLYSQMPTNITFSGYEISPQAFELCQQRKKDRLQFLLKDIFQDNNAFFDLILAIDVFEHIEDYFGFLRNLRKKGQYKIFHIPLNLSVQSVFRSFPIMRERQKVGHIHYFTKETALATLADTGYEILDYFYTACSIDLPATSFKSALARLPRKMMYKLNKDIAVRLLGGYSLMVLTK
ncbi:MAG: class I SAM-dependent methyltransferase [Elusimicrobia bacterium]|nr:class I SAM-dependent methyltransferase [Elusimicrobiota bacterium]